MKKQNTNLKELLTDLEEKLEEIFVDKIPYQIPNNIKELIVNYGPYLLVFSLFFQFLNILNVGYFTSYFGLMGVKMGLVYQVERLFLLITLIIEAVAIALPGLFQKKLSSWRLLFYSSLVMVVRGVVVFDIFGLVISTLLSWYLLFQIKEYYK